MTFIFSDTYNGEFASFTKNLCAIDQYFKVIRLSSLNVISFDVSKIRGDVDKAIREEEDTIVFCGTGDTLGFVYKR